MTDHSAAARMLFAEEGHHILHPTGASMNVKVLSSETGGAYSLMETVLPPGGVVPLHVHQAEDENNYILEGELTMHIGECVYRATAGCYVVAPRGVTQHFRNEGSTECRFLTTFTPGGAEEFFRQAHELIRRAAPGSPSQDELLALQQKFQLRYL